MPRQIDNLHDQLFMAFIFSASWACLHGSAHNIQSHNPQQVGSIQYSFICITRLTMDIVNLHIHCASSMNTHTHTHIVQLYSRVVCGFLTKRVLHGALSNGETLFCILGFNIEKVTHYEVLKNFLSVERSCMWSILFRICWFVSSGAHRPVGAQSGQYLYCPPQRWINNLKVNSSLT